MRTKLALGTRVSAGGEGACAVSRQTTCWGAPSLGSGVWMGQVTPPSQLNTALAPMRNQPVSTYGASWTGQTSVIGPRKSQAWSSTAGTIGTCTFVKVSPWSRLNATAPAASSVPK